MTPTRRRGTSPGSIETPSSNSWEASRTGFWTTPTRRKTISQRSLRRPKWGIPTINKLKEDGFYITLFCFCYKFYFYSLFKHPRYTQVFKSFKHDVYFKKEGKRKIKEKPWSSGLITIPNNMYPNRQVVKEKYISKTRIGVKRNSNNNNNNNKNNKRANITTIIESLDLRYFKMRLENSNKKRYAGSEEIIRKTKESHYYYNV